MELFEFASDIEDDFRASAIKAVRENKPIIPHNFDGVNCIEEICGFEIEPERLKSGCIRCYDCQTLLEKRLKRGIQ